MADFLVELYVSRTNQRGLDSVVTRGRDAAEELSRSGTAVRYLRSIFIPADELCFLLFEAASADHVREAARSAGLPFERISEAVTSAEPMPTLRR
jgi:Nickel responsive protein SCO4226-like